MKCSRFFEGHCFGVFAKILRTPKNLPAPTPMYKIIVGVICIMLLSLMPIEETGCFLWVRYGLKARPACTVAKTVDIKWRKLQWRIYEKWRQ